MTEAEWLSRTDPRPMLEFLRDKASDRKLRLYGCACVRRMSCQFNDLDLSDVLRVSEGYADGTLRRGHLATLRSQIGVRGGYSALWAIENALRGLLHPNDFVAARGASNYAVQACGLFAREARDEASGDVDELAHAALRSEELAQVTLLQDIFGPLPFRPVAINPRWRTSTVLALASGIYDDRAFDRLSILADALEDAGCDSTDLMAHCRDDGGHARGCWAVDLALGKE